MQTVTPYGYRGARGPNRVLQVKSAEESDGYNAVQLGYDDQSKPERQSKPLRGHFEKQGGKHVKLVKEFRDYSLEVNTGDEVPVTILRPAITLTPLETPRARISGRCEALELWRWPREPWSKRLVSSPRWYRSLCHPRLGGARQENARPHGPESRTVQNLEVIQVREEDGVLLIKGAIPGSKGDYVVIRVPKARQGSQSITRHDDGT